MQDQCDILSPTTINCLISLGFFLLGPFYLVVFKPNKMLLKVVKWFVVNNQLSKQRNRCLMVEVGIALAKCQA